MRLLFLLGEVVSVENLSQVCKHCREEECEVSSPDLSPVGGRASFWGGLKKGKLPFLRWSQDIRIRTARTSFGR